MFVLGKFRELHSGYRTIWDFAVLDIKIISDLFKFVCFRFTVRNL